MGVGQSGPVSHYYYLSLFHLQSVSLCLFLSLFLFTFPTPTDGVAAFRAFLKTEFSEENLEFWLACEEFKKTRSTAKLVSKAHRIFEEFVDVQAPREVCWRWRESCKTSIHGSWLTSLSWRGFEPVLLGTVS